MDSETGSKVLPPSAERDYSLWQKLGASTAVQLSLDVINDLLAEALTGFGAIPRRGAEIGGILIGCIQGNTVRIENCEVVPCEYRRGPSYLLSEADQTAFATVFKRWEPDGEKAVYAVGYFRSNTRDQFVTVAEDCEIMRRYFPEPPSLMLLIRPYASRPTVGGFVVYEEGTLSPTPVGEFTLRHNMQASAKPRADLSIIAAPKNEAFTASVPQENAGPEASVPVADVGASLTPAYSETELPAALLQAPKSRRRWQWLVTFAIVFIIGTVGGFMGGVRMTAQPDSVAPSHPYSLSLVVSKAGDNLQLRWDGQCKAIRRAQRGTLEISDGSYAKAVALSGGELHNGSVIYHNRTSEVLFRLVVYIRSGTSVSESVEWKY